MLLLIALSFLVHLSLALPAWNLPEYAAINSGVVPRTFYIEGIRPFRSGGTQFFGSSQFGWSAFIFVSAHLILHRGSWKPYHCTYPGTLNVSPPAAATVPGRQSHDPLSSECPQRDKRPRHNIPSRSNSLRDPTSWSEGVLELGWKQAAVPYGQEYKSRFVLRLWTVGTLYVLGDVGSIFYDYSTD